MSLRDEVLKEISDIEKAKEEGRRRPTYALDEEVKARFPGRGKEVMEVLRRLYKAGEIEAGKTLNNTWIRIKTKKDGV